jgi:hypothetical protein
MAATGTAGEGVRANSAQINQVANESLVPGGGEKGSRWVAQKIIVQPVGSPLTFLNGDGFHFPSCKGKRPGEPGRLTLEMKAAEVRNPSG